MGQLFTSAAHKAHVGALVGFLGPIGAYVAATGDWSWRAFTAAVVAGLVTGLSVYEVPNATPTVARDPLGGL